MKGLRVLLTGGGRGIGACIAKALVKEGCSLAICARTFTEVQAVSEQARGYSGIIHPLSCDISNQKDVEGMIENVTNSLGGIDVLINNAAIAGPVGALETTNSDMWRQAIDVNLMGAVNCSRAVLPVMKRDGGGQIINFLGAGVGWKGFEPGKTAYITSKFAVYGFTEALANEVKDNNILVNALSPGTADTNLRGALNPDKPMEGAESTNQVIDLVKFLLLKPSLHLTGKILSARWDDVTKLEDQAVRLNKTSSLTLRKIDDLNYFER